jgi:hypothetical protein
MTNKYSKTAINSIFILVYTFFNKIFLFFFFLKKGRYNWYNSKKIDVPTLNCSKLYQDPYISFGTIGTILKLMLITNAYLSKFSTFTICSLFTKCSKSKQYQQNKGRARIFLFYIFLFYESGSIQ